LRIALLGDSDDWLLKAAARVAAELGGRPVHPLADSGALLPRVHLASADGATEPSRDSARVTVERYPGRQLAMAYAAAERRAIEVLQRISVPLLRTAMSVVFVWFGWLKLANATPVGDLVAAALPFVDRRWSVPAVGAAEVLLGLGLLVGWPLRIILPALVGHLSSTFLVLLARSDLAFQKGNPLLLTTDGEFVVKNLVLVCAALVLAARLLARDCRYAGPTTDPDRS
jgi:uncharacterized membrane protein YkgB